MFIILGTFDSQYNNMVYDDVYLYTSYKYCLSKTNRIELIVMNVRHVKGSAFFSTIQSALDNTHRRVTKGYASY